MIFVQLRGFVKPAIVKIASLVLDHCFTQIQNQARDRRVCGELRDVQSFVAPRNWSHRGTVTVSNVSDTLHFMDLEPVKPGTTDREVQAYFDSGAQSQPPWSLDGPYGG